MQQPISRYSSKLAIVPSDPMHPIDAARVDGILRAWMQVELGHPVQPVEQNERDVYFRTRDPSLTLKSRELMKAGDGNGLQFVSRINPKTGERSGTGIGGHGELIIQKTELADTHIIGRDTRVLSYLSPEQAGGIHALLADGLAYDLSVDKHRRHYANGSWYVNFDTLPQLEGNLTPATHHFIELQQNVDGETDTQSAKDFNDRIKRLEEALHEAEPSWKLEQTRSSYRELMAKHLADEPIRRARENTWLHTMSLNDVLKISGESPRKVDDSLLMEGVQKGGNAFIVASGSFDVFVGGHKVKSFQPGDVFGDVGPLAQGLGFVKPMQDGAVLRFGEVRPTKGVEASVIPIPKEMMEDMCRSGALNGFRSIIKRFIAEWKQPGHESFLSA